MCSIVQSRHHLIESNLLSPWYIRKIAHYLAWNKTHSLYNIPLLYYHMDVHCMNMYVYCDINIYIFYMRLDCNIFIFLLSDAQFSSIQCMGFQFFLLKNKSCWFIYIFEPPLGDDQISVVFTPTCYAISAYHQQCLTVWFSHMASPRECLV